MRRTVLTLVVCWGLTLPALGWNATGHMMVEEIAIQHVSANVRAQVDALLAIADNPQSGQPVSVRDDGEITAATYMDDIRPTFETLHYIDRYIDVDGHVLDRPAPAPNAVNEYHTCIEILEDHVHSRPAKAEALRYVIHLVGDLHQPLHCVTRVSPQHPDGDRGGNDFALTGRYHNLHQWWDHAGGRWFYLHRPLSTRSQEKLDSLVSRVTTDWPEISFGSAASDTKVEHWVQESESLAATQCYVGVTEGTSPDQDYRDKTTRLCERQVALAGYRLAAVFTEVFATAHTSRSTAVAISPGSQAANPSLTQELPSNR